MVTKDEIIAFLKTDFPQFEGTVDSVGDKSAIVRQKITHAHLRPGGTVSGPTMFALADSGIYVAILGEIGIVPLAVTTNLTINFMRKPSATNDLVAHCNLIKVGRSLIVGEIYIYSEGMDEPVAHAVGTYAVPPSKS